MNPKGFPSFQRRGDLATPNRGWLETPQKLKTTKKADLFRPASLLLIIIFL